MANDLESREENYNFPLLGKCLDCDGLFSTEERIPYLRFCGHCFCKSCIEKERKCSKCNTISPKKWKNPKNELLLELCTEMNKIRDYARDLENIIEENAENIAVTEASESVVSSNEDENIPIESKEIEKKIRQLEIKTEKLNETFNKDLNIIDNKIMNYTEALPHCLSVMELCNSIAYSQSGYPLRKSIREGHELMSKLLKEKGTNKDIFKTPLTEFPNSPINSEHKKPFDFNEQSHENLNALKGIDNCYVGYRINDILRWGKINTIQDTLLFSAFEMPKENFKPNPEATLVHFNWLKELIVTYKMMFLKFEVNDECMKTLLETNKECPKSFHVFVNLNSDFMNSPHARQFYYLSTGEKGKSYVNSEVKVTKFSIEIKGNKENELIPGIPDLGDEGGKGHIGSVNIIRMTDCVSRFVINRKEMKMNRGYIHIGSLYENLVLNYFDTEMNLKISDCGYVIV